MKNKSVKKILLIILFLTILSVSGGGSAWLYYKRFHQVLPDDGLHKDRSSKFLCLGCHNTARVGGSSFEFHYNQYECNECHIPKHMEST